MLKLAKKPEVKVLVVRKEEENNIQSSKSEEQKDLGKD